MKATDLSYASGEAQVPFIGTTIGQQFDRTVAQWGDRLGLVSRGQNIRWTYAELAERVDAAAAGLLSLGLEPGDRVGIWSPNNAEWIITQFATAKAGLILVNINPAYRTNELEYCLKKVGCKVLVFADRFKTSDYGAMLREIAPEIDGCAQGELHAEALPDLRFLIQIGGDSAGLIAFDDLLKLGDAAAQERLAELGDHLQFDAPINIQFTSGTTGSPKGATLTHHNILNNGFFIGQTLRYTENDIVCVPVPLYHCFGMVIGALACLTHGSALVMPSEAFEPLATLQAIDEEHCTSVYGVPTMFIAELDHPDFDSFDMSSLRTGVMAGSPCPAEVMRRCIDRMNLTEMTICYGMTETSPVSMQTRIGDPLDKQVTTVGCVHPHLEVKIVDTEGRIVPRGDVGEFCLRGYSVMAGYWGDADATSAAIDAARWMHSGDLATMDSDAYVNIVGRMTDMVIRGGENIYPREVEEFLYGHPDVQEVQVFGVSDERLGEEVCAWVKLREGADLQEQDLRDYCTGKIAHYKVPRYVQFVSEFPMTVTGKAQKYKMRETAEATLSDRAGA